MSQHKLLEKLIDEVSKNLTLSINSIVKLGQAHPVLALKILAVPVVCISISIPMFACWLMLKSLYPPRCFPKDYNRFDREINDSHLEQRFDPPPSENTSDRKPELFLNELPITRLPLSSEFDSSNPFVASNAPPDRHNKLGDNINVIPESRLFLIPDNNFIRSNPTKNDNKIDLNALSAFSGGELLDELNRFETLILPNSSLFSSSEEILLSLNRHKGVKSVPDPASAIALLAIAGISLKILRKK